MENFQGSDKMNHCIQDGKFDSKTDDSQRCLPVEKRMNPDKYSSYDLEEYKKDIETIGLEETWNGILSFVREDCSNSFLAIDHLAELYEKGLALQDKYAKKLRGQYYTPDDVAVVMAKWLDPLPGEVVCDVACGTGRLIFAYLELIGFENARRLLEKGFVYLYDIDKTALTICKTILLHRYGIGLENSIHAICGDFLNRDVVLPPDCKVISNPPYSEIKSVPTTWNMTEVVQDTRELYSIFMEKSFNKVAVPSS